MARLLFIEDDASIGQLYKAEFSQEGHEVIVESNGNAALESVEEHTPDMVVLDIMLPGTDGVTLLERLRRKHRSLPIIVATAYGAYQGSESIWAADECVIKSGDLTDLKQAIQRHLKSSTPQI